MHEAIRNMPTPESPRLRFVHHALTIGALELLPEGRELKSKRISPYFYNAGLYLTGFDIRQLAEAYAFTAMSNFDFDVIFGPAYKGIPLATAVAMVVTEQTDNATVGYAFDRKEAKDHGEGGIIVGHPLEGQRVLIVDDVITDGKTKATAVKTVKDQGGIIVGLAIAFDRQERGRDSDLSAVEEVEANHGVKVVSTANLDDLIEFLDEVVDYSHDCEIRDIVYKIRAYRTQYGTNS